MSFPNVALIGCGAVARAFYLPVLTKHRGRFGEIWLVDPADRARANAATMLRARQAHRFSDVEAPVDLVIIATGNDSHFALANDALRRGADVLIEEPFVT